METKFFGKRGNAPNCCMLRKPELPRGTSNPHSTSAKAALTGERLQPRRNLTSSRLVGRNSSSASGSRNTNAKPARNKSEASGPVHFVCALVGQNKLLAFGWRYSSPVLFRWGEIVQKKSPNGSGQRRKREESTFCAQKRRPEDRPKRCDRMRTRASLRLPPAREQSSAACPPADGSCRKWPRRPRS